MKYGLDCTERSLSEWVSLNSVQCRWCWQSVMCQKKYRYMYSDDVCISLFAFVIIWQCTRGKEIFYIMLDKINSIHLINGSIKILLYLVSEIYQFCFRRKKLPYLTVDRKKEFKDVIVTKTRLITVGITCVKACWITNFRFVLHHEKANKSFK